MKNPFAWFFRRVFGRSHTPSVPPKPPLSPEQFRELLIEALDNPATARLLARKLLLPAFPIQGGAMTAAADVTSGNFGANYSDAGNYNFAGGGNVGIGTTTPGGLGAGGTRTDVQIHNPGTDAVSFGNLVLSSASTANGALMGAVQFGSTGLSATEKRTASIGSSKRDALTANPVGDLQFATANGGTPTVKMTIDKDGNVGVGTTAPSYKLQVEGDQMLESSQGATARLVLNQPSIQTWYLDNNADTGSLSFTSAIAGGKVGIGTTSPLVKLDARGSNAKATTAAFENIIEAASTDSSNPLALRAGIKTDATAGNRYGAIEVDDAGTKRALALQPSGGNVGIGTTNPQVKLHVKSGSDGIGFLIEGDDNLGRLGFLKTGAADAANVIYRNQDDFTVLRNFSRDWAILKIWSKPGAVTGDREATLALVRGDNDEEFMDIYNNGYTAEKQYGVRMQRLKGNGVFRDFVFDQRQQDPPNPFTTYPAILVVRATRKIGVGTRTTPAKLAVKGESFTATGTVSTSGTTVTGTNTLFTQEVDVGDKITVSGTPAETRTVTAVNSETSLTVDSAFGNAHTNATMTVVNNLLRVDDASGNVKVFVTDQGNVGIGTGSPAASALLDLSSTTGALIVPRMTTTQRDALTPVVNGMIIYNTTTNQMQGYINGAWAAM